MLQGEDFETSYDQLGKSSKDNLITANVSDLF